MFHIFYSDSIDSLVERKFSSKVVHFVDEWFCVVSISILSRVGEGKKLASIDCELLKIHSSSCWQILVFLKLLTGTILKGNWKTASIKR